MKPKFRKELMQYDVQERDFVSDVMKFLDDRKLFEWIGNYEVHFSKNDRRLLRTREVVGKVGRYRAKLGAKKWWYNVWIIRKPN